MLAEDGGFYVNFFNRIKSFPFWARPLKSVWLIKTSSSRGQIMEYLKPTVAFTDKLLIIQVTNDWIALRLSDTIVKWMKRGL